MTPPSLGRAPGRRAQPRRHYLRGFPRNARSQKSWGPQAGGDTPSQFCLSVTTCSEFPSGTAPGGEQPPPPTGSLSGPSLSDTQAVWGRGPESGLQTLPTLSVRQWQTVSDSVRECQSDTDCQTGSVLGGISSESVTLEGGRICSADGGLLLQSQEYRECLGRGESSVAIPK